MKKSDIHPLPAFFDQYIHQVDDLELTDALAASAPENLFAPDGPLLELGDRVYAPGKWTVNDIVQHCLDTERIMAYRALRFARYDRTPLPGFEEDAFASHARASRRTLPDLLGEWTTLRQSTQLLFRSFDEEMLRQTGGTFKGEISVLALGFVICGHPMHHLQVIRERYFPLLESQA
jgi:hypothetical protein